MADKELDEPTLRSLVAFSAAQAYSVDTNNPVEVVVPLFQPIATTLHGRSFEAAALAKEIYDRYGLIVSEELCQFWATRLVSLKMLSPVLDGSEAGGYVWQQISEVVPNKGFASELQTIVLTFRDFLKKTNDLLSVNYSDSQIVELMKRGVIGTMFQKLYDTEAMFRSDDHYIFSRFTQWLSLNHPASAETLGKLRRAAIFSDLILHVREPRRPPSNAQPVSVYFDSPLVMDAIGLSGPKRRWFSTRILEAFKVLRFTPLVNPEMLFEIRNNIKALLSTPPGRRYGPTAESLRRGEITLDVINATIDRLESVIQASGIGIDQNFSSHVDRSVLDDSLEQELFSRLQSNYQFVEAARRDAKTIRGVFGRRSDAKVSSIYACRALFVTANDMVTTVANRFFRERVGYNDRVVPVVMARTTLAALTDAVVGVHNDGSLSTTEMLVSAEEATQYNVDVVDEIERRLRAIDHDEADNLVALISLTDYSELAMDAALGNPRNITEQTIVNLVAAVKGEFRTEAEKEVAAARARERTIGRRQQDELLQHLALRELALEQAIQQIRGQGNSAKIALADRYLRYTRRLKVLEYALTTFSLLIGVAAASLAFLAINNTEMLEQNTILKLLVAGCIGVVTGYPLIGVPSLRGTVRAWVHSRLVNSLRAFASQFSVDLPKYVSLGDLPQFEAQVSDVFAAREEKIRVAARRETLL
jgi:hypothetical protein